MKGKGSILVEISVLLVAIVAMILLLPSASAQGPQLGLISSPNLSGGYNYYDPNGWGMVGSSSRNLSGGLDYYVWPNQSPGGMMNQGYAAGQGLANILNAFRRTPAAPPKPRPVQRPKRKTTHYTDWDHKYW